MSPFRASDEQLDREIIAVEGLVRVRLRRASDDLKELDAALRELRRERRRRELSEAGTDSAMSEGSAHV